ncbi:S-layer homology domain-containing protein [Ructibacterium gallinarum]|uniref:S-layer homology domain-containing protein n=1 Tax=Ructibacterium gallinarum TaxID=2779355 RepID=A0A9D5R9H1_9FIRM|nr:S-layer homology domain-containing protein [Ructibacterium gallinarum]MBE5041022.1 S-layer homology domain-containing protein [Ructibacterium gallinarum]
MRKRIFCIIVCISLAVSCLTVVANTQIGMLTAPGTYELGDVIRLECRTAISEYADFYTSEGKLNSQSIEVDPNTLIAFYDWTPTVAGVYTVYAISGEAESEPVRLWIVDTYTEKEDVNIQNADAISQDGYQSATDAMSSGIVTYADGVVALDSNPRGTLSGSTKNEPVISFAGNEAKGLLKIAYDISISVQTEINEEFLTLIYFGTDWRNYFRGVAFKAVSQEERQIGYYNGSTFEAFEDAEGNAVTYEPGRRYRVVTYVDITTGLGDVFVNGRKLTPAKVDFSSSVYGGQLSENVSLNKINLRNTNLWNADSITQIYRFSIETAEIYTGEGSDFAVATEDWLYRDMYGAPYTDIDLSQILDAVNANYAKGFSNGYQTSEGVLPENVFMIQEDPKEQFFVSINSDNYTELSRHLVAAIDSTSSLAYSIFRVFIGEPQDTKTDGYFFFELGNSDVKIKAGVLRSGDATLLPYLECGTAEQVSERALMANQWYTGVLKLDYAQNQLALKFYSDAELPGMVYDVVLDDIEPISIDAVGFTVDAFKTDPIYMGAYTVVLCNEAYGLAETKLNDAIRVVQEGGMDAQDEIDALTQAIEELEDSAVKQQFQKELQTLIKYAPMYNTIISLVRNGSVAELVAMRDEIDKLEDQAQKYILLPLLNSAEESIAYRQRISDLTAITIESINAAELYQQAMILSKEIQDSNLDAVVKELLLSELEEYKKGFASYPLEISRRTLEFPYSDGTVLRDIDGWYGDFTLQTPPDETAVIKERALVVPQDKAVYTKLDREIDFTAADEYWIKYDFAFSEDTDGFSGLAIGENYRFGILGESGVVHPYIAAEAPQDAKYETIFDDFISNDIKYISSYHVNYVASATAEFDGTRLRRVNKDDEGYVIYAVNQVESVRATMLQQANVATRAKIYYSTNQVIWTEAETSHEQGFSGSWIQWDSVATNIPDDAAFIKIVIPYATTTSGGDADIWNDLCSVEIKQAKATPAAISAVDEKILEAGKTYTAVIRADQGSNQIKMMVFPADEAPAGEWLFEFDDIVPDDVYSVIGLLCKAGGFCVERIVIESADSVYFSDVTEKIQKMEETKAYADIKQAQQAVSSLSNGLAREIYENIVDRYLQENKTQLPVIDYISIDGSGREQELVKANVSVTDNGGNLNEILYTWTLDGKVISNTSAVTVPGNSAGNTLMLSAIPVTIEGLQGEEKSTSIKITGNSMGGTYYGTGGGGIGSSGNSGSLISSTEPTEQPGTKPATPSPFSDIEGHWAYDTIMSMYRTNIVKGYGDGTFCPEQTITRAEFAEICFGLFTYLEEDTDVANAMHFQDVKESDWFYKSVSAMSALEIIQGYDNMFEPERLISREEMAKVIYGLYEHVVGFSSYTSRQFSDEAEISDWAVAYVRACGGLGLLNGMENGNFAPREAVTRAQAATAIYNLLAISNKTIKF